MLICCYLNEIEGGDVWTQILQRDSGCLEARQIWGQTGEVPTLFSSGTTKTAVSYV